MACFVEKRTQTVPFNPSWANQSAPLAGSNSAAACFGSYRLRIPLRWDFFVFGGAGFESCLLRLILFSLVLLAWLLPAPFVWSAWLSRAPSAVTRLLEDFVLYICLIPSSSFIYTARYSSGKMLVAHSAAYVCVLYTACSIDAYTTYTLQKDFYIQVVYTNNCLPLYTTPALLLYPTLVAYLS